MANKSVALLSNKEKEATISSSKRLHQMYSFKVSFGNSINDLCYVHWIQSINISYALWKMAGVHNAACVFEITIWKKRCVCINCKEMPQSIVEINQSITYFISYFLQYNLPRLHSNERTNERTLLYIFDRNG